MAPSSVLLRLLRAYDAVLKAAFAPDYKILTVFLSRFGAETAVGNHLQRWEQRHGRSELVGPAGQKPCQV